MINPQGKGGRGEPVNDQPNRNPNRNRCTQMIRHRCGNNLANDGRTGAKQLHRKRTPQRANVDPIPFVKTEKVKWRHTTSPTQQFTSSYNSHSRNKRRQKTRLPRVPRRHTESNDGWPAVTVGGCPEARPGRGRRRTRKRTMNKGHLRQSQT